MASRGENHEKESDVGDGNRRGNGLSLRLRGASRPSTPAELAVPAVNSLMMKVLTDGAQIYTCSAKVDNSGYKWVFKAPEALLTDEKGGKLGNHYGGPSWEANNGSKITATVKARTNSTDPNAIPWLLLETKLAGKDGPFAKIAFIRRLETVGGKDPASGCDGANLNKEARVGYTATYLHVRQIRRKIVKIFGVGKLIVLLTMLVSVGWAQGLEGNFVGAAKNSKAFVAIVATQGKVLAYVCDGEKTAQWFRGTVGASGDIAIELGSNKFNARLNTGVVSGTVEVGGEKLEFSAAAATGNAGLFRAELTAGGSNYTGGWIIDQNGEQRGAVIGGGGFQASISELLLGGGEGVGGSLCQGVKVTNTRSANIQGVGRVAAWQVGPACVGAAR